MDKGYGEPFAGTKGCKQLLISKEEMKVAVRS